MRRRFSLVFVSVLGLCTSLPASSDAAQANGGSFGPAISGNGRFVALGSGASNLVPDDTNGVGDVFVHDRTTARTERVSVDSSGIQANSESFGAAISGDGRFVAFLSEASNLVSSDTNGVQDVFVHDRMSGTTERVSVDGAGNQANGGSGVPAISGDGRLVVFVSLASNLVPGDTNDTLDIFVHDRQTGTIERVIVDGTGNEHPRISGGGRFVAFAAVELYVHDRLTSMTEQVHPGESFDAAISGDGRFVAFVAVELYVHDRQTATTELVSIESTSPAISGDGRFVSFISVAGNLVPGDTNGAHDVFVRDRAAGTTERVSVNSSGNQGNSTSFAPAISADGRFVAFPSDASNLVPADTNGVADVFVHDRQSGTTERVSVGSQEEPPPDDLPDLPPSPEAPMAGEPEGEIDPAKDVTIVITCLLNLLVLRMGWVHAAGKGGDRWHRRYARSRPRTPTRSWRIGG